MRFFMGLVLAAGVCAPAWAQREHLVISRPSEFGPSSQIGLLGGVYTRTMYSDSTLPSRGRAGGFSRSLQQMNFFGAARNVSRIAPPPLPQAFLPSLLQVSTARMPSPYWARFRDGVVWPSSLAEASQFRLTERLDAPLLGFRTYTPNVKRTPYFAPRPPSSFHAFFGLSEHRPPPRQAREGATLSELVEQDNQRFVEESWRQALALFKRATSDDENDEIDNRQELLARAAEQAATAARIDPTRAEPHLLLLLINLERNRTNSALVYLEQVVRRRPTLFAESNDIAEYFGDYVPASDKSGGRSQRLEALLRRYLQIGDRSGSGELYALQGFAAWGIGDPVRLRVAVKRLGEAKMDDTNRRSMLRIRNSLQAGLRNMVARGAP